MVGAALLSLSAVVPSTCTPHPSSPAASSSPQATGEGGTTKWRGSSAHSAALPSVLKAAMAKMMLPTVSVDPRLRMQSLAAAEKTACCVGQEPKAVGWGWVSQSWWHNGAYECRALTGWATVESRSIQMVALLS